MAGLVGKWARLELERRFLVGLLPEGIVEDRSWRIDDRYITGTQMRLRRMERVDGGETIFKLGQKRVLSPPDYSTMTISSIVLSPGEYDVLAHLQSLELHKVRHQVEQEDQRTYSVDVFTAHLSGLILAEIDFETREEMERSLELPPWVIREVSDEVQFTGGALASLTTDQAAELIRQIQQSRC